MRAMSRWKKVTLLATLLIFCLIGVLSFLTFRDQCMANFLAASANPRWLAFAARHGTNLNRACTRDGSFPIVDAVESRNGPTVAFLLSQGIAVNVRNRDLATPLIIAAEKGETDMVKKLLSAGADVNAVDITGSSAVRYAARTGSYETTDVLIKAGANVNVADVEGDTALMLAAQGSNSKLIDLLLQSGADRFQRDKRGRRALDYLPEPRQPALVQALEPK